VALILSLLNMFVKPLLVAVSLPVTILKLGLFLIIINTAMLGLTAWIAGQMDDLRFDIDDFWAALVGAIIISIVSFVLGIFIDADKMARGLTKRVR
jgi:putative membrane protein